MVFIAGVFESFSDFIAKLGRVLSFDVLMFVFLGIQAAVLLFFAYRATRSYEVQLLKGVDKMNRYLRKKQYITEKNLIEFNRAMRNMPGTLRYHWQQFMLFRDKKPSEYMSAQKCVEVPLRSSTFESSLRCMNYLSWFMAALSFMVGAASLSAYDYDNYATFFFRLCVIPLFIVLLSTILLLVLRVRHTNVKTELYQVFNTFELFMDKALVTMPEYVDYEILFTKNEIKKRIPILNEYLEKRRIAEQEELKRAKERALMHEDFTFDNTDEKGTIVLDRAMKETEIYLNARTLILAEIAQKEGELENYRKAYENKSMEIQRKLQANKENIERLRDQQENTTNRIEINYIKKQLSDEIKKQQQFEKDLDTETGRFKADSSELINEIDKLNKDLDVCKHNLEKAMMSEYQTLSTKIYKEVVEVAEEKVSKEQGDLFNDKVKFKQRYQKAMDIIDVLSRQLAKNGIEPAVSTTVILDEEEKPKTPASFAAENKEKARPRPESKTESKAEMKLDLKAEPKEEPKPEPKPQPRLVELRVDHRIEATNPAPKIEHRPAEPTYDEYGGYYDSQGYYRYENGTYYDPSGNFYDGNGGYFDKDGNYHTPQAEKTEDPYEEIIIESETPDIIEFASDENSSIQEKLNELNSIVEGFNESEEADGDSEEETDNETGEIKTARAKKDASVSSAKRLEELKAKNKDKKKPGRPKNS